MVFDYPTMVHTVFSGLIFLSSHVTFAPVSTWGSKAPGASSVSPVSGVSVVWTVVSPVCGVCVMWTVVLPISVIPRVVVTPISVVTIPVPIGGATAQYRRYKKNNQENQHGFSHGLAPLRLLLKSGRGVLFASIDKTMGWGRFIQCRGSFW